MKLKKYIIPIIIAIIIIIIGIIGFCIYFFDSNSTSSNLNTTTATAPKVTTSKTSSSKTSTTPATSTEKIVYVNSNKQSSSTGNNYSSTATNSTNAVANESTDNFSGIINGSNYLIGSIEGDTIIIPLNSNIVENKQLILHEYYVDRLNEVFTLKIDSLSNNNYVMYEYYNGVNTGIFKLKSNSSPYCSTLSGTYSKPNSNVLIGITFRSFSGNSIISYPFFVGTVDNVPVTFAQTTNGSGFYEKYSGDNNIFNLRYDYAYSNNQSYDTILDESFNGKISGKYKLNISSNGKVLTGIYIPSSNPNLKYPVTFTGSFSPN